MSEKIIQLPLPNPDVIPAWVSAALDSININGKASAGLNCIVAMYDELNNVTNCMRRIEEGAFNSITQTALAWQRANYRTHITAFEKYLLELEKKALAHPYSTRTSAQTEYYRDADGELKSREVEVVTHDTQWIAEYIQRELGSSMKFIMGSNQIKSILNDVSAVYKACECLDREVEIKATRDERLQKGLRKVA